MNPIIIATNINGFAAVLNLIGYVMTKKDIHVFWLAINIIALIFVIGATLA